MAKEVLTTEQIRYRQFEKADLDEMLDLWSNHSGWGDLTKDDFLFWYEQNPHGKGVIVVAEDENRRIFGATSFVPARLFAGNKTFKTFRAVSPIVHSSYRHSDLRHSQHPAIGMLTEGFRIFKEEGYRIGYAFPARGWLAVSRILPGIIPGIQLQDATYGCVSFPTQASIPDLPQHFTMSYGEGFGHEYDLLWKEAIDSLPVHCSIERTAGWLNWKYRKHWHFELRNRHNNRLLAYCLIQKNSGLIEDLFGIGWAEMKAILMGVWKNMSQSHHAGLLQVDFSMKAMLSPVMTSLLEGCEVKEEPFEFAFCCLLQDPDLEYSHFPREQWHLMPND